jgi:hypothetical protein
MATTSAARELTGDVAAIGKWLQDAGLESTPELAAILATLCAGGGVPALGNVKELDLVQAGAGLKGIKLRKLVAALQSVGSTTDSAAKLAEPSPGSAFDYLIAKDGPPSTPRSTSSSERGASMTGGGSSAALSPNVTDRALATLPGAEGDAPAAPSEAPPTVAPLSTATTLPLAEPSARAAPDDAPPVFTPRTAATISTLLKEEAGEVAYDLSDAPLTPRTAEAVCMSQVSVEDELLAAQLQAESESCQMGTRAPSFALAWSRAGECPGLLRGVRSNPVSSSGRGGVGGGRGAGAGGGEEGAGEGEARAEEALAQG